MTQTVSTSIPAKTSDKWVYLFQEGGASMRDLLGGKGAGCAEMTKAGLPVPAGFTITTAACNAFYDHSQQLPPGLWEQAQAALKSVEGMSGKIFGSAANPLLVSVRSGAKFSMPGMMDTVLNLGLNDDVTRGLAALTQNDRFAYDAYRRFIQLYGKIVLGIDGDIFEHALTSLKADKGAVSDTDLNVAALQELVATFKSIVRNKSGNDFPTDPYQQLEGAIVAVFQSWNGRRAIDYRRRNKIADSLGTAVNVQTMVFGNMGSDSGTGVAFTRNPSTGERKLYGEFLMNAQGEDVVAGIRTPEPITALQERAPTVYKEFADIADRMERHYKDVQDLEFTIERGTLYMLQTRSAKRTGPAWVKSSVDMVREGLIDESEAVKRVPANDIVQLLLPRFDDGEKSQLTAAGKRLAVGLNASPGAATGKAVFTADRSEEWAKAGQAVIMIRPETSPEDYHGMIVATGILTARGGGTSHAAVVARGAGLPCVVGAGELIIDPEHGEMRAGSVVVKEGDDISIDGATGEVFAGHLDTHATNFNDEVDLQTLLGWADQRRRLEVWANGDYPHDAERAREFGAQGIGLCRTEHMFFQQERLPVVQRMILATTDGERQRELDTLLPMQTADFKGLLRAMDGLPVVIRLIDPPLHEFLPSLEELLVQVTELRVRGNNPTELVTKQALLEQVEAMHEQNPMLGLRGIRLGLTFPAIIEMQVRAIVNASCELVREGRDPRPEIMVPLVGHVNEMSKARAQMVQVIKDVQATQGITLPIKIGTMIEVPRAALTAGAIASEAEFFSFGTNDLTQTTYGYSRDDAEGKFLMRYVDDKILPDNPFQVLDRDGVGSLMQQAVENGRSVRPDLEIGICGEHGGEPSSIEFCDSLGLNYVSCSPFRIPVARLAAAQAAMNHGERDR